jgi:HEPN domain-containing protein
MKRPLDLARRFLLLADRDVRAFRRLAESDDIDDETVGFHAQQAVEKCLKVVIALHGIPFRRTHNLDELVDLLIDHHAPRPPNVELFQGLTRFAVEFRYDVEEVMSLDRPQAHEIVEPVRRWAADQVQ